MLTREELLRLSVKAFDREQAAAEQNQMPTREELLDQLKALILRREQAAAEQNHRECRRIKVEMRMLDIELSKLKTESWRDDPAHFCRAFKVTAKRVLDDETYCMLVNETVQWLKHRHNT
jgi:hypothetical protein